MKPSSTRRVRMGRFLAVALTALLGMGCRAFSIDGATFADRSVLGRTTLTTEELDARTYVANDATLTSLESAMDRGIGADLNALDMTLQVRPQGTVTFLEMATSPRGALATGGFSSAGSSPYAALDLVALPAEVRNFFAMMIDPFRGVDASGVLPPTPPVPTPSAGPIGDFMQRAMIRVPGGRDLPGGIELSWDMPRATDPDPSAPVLVMRVVFHVDEEAQGWLLPLVVVDITHLALVLRIQPTLCSLESGGNCSHRRAVGGVFAGYTGPGTIEAAPDANIDLQFATDAESEAIVAVLPTCYTTPVPPGTCEAAQVGMFYAIDEIESSLRAISGVVGVGDALQRGLMPLAFNAGDFGTIDVGVAPVRVDPMGTSGLPPFTAPFGAAGGLWGDNAILGLSRDMTLTVPVGPTSTSATLGLASPNYARLVEFAPYFASEMRRIFAEPALRAAASRGVWTPSGVPAISRARFTSVTPVAATGSSSIGASFSWIFDADVDGIDDRLDHCPDVADVPLPDGSIADEDDDGLFDSCDNCPGFASEHRGDRDADGIGAPCDCNADGDMCPERPFDEVRGRGSDCTVPPGGAYDRYPRGTPLVDVDGDGIGDIADTDGDGLPNDCDADSDDDGVGDEDDNCPLVANSDQANSGGGSSGDACDPLCPFDGAVGCLFASGDWANLRVGRWFAGASPFTFCLGPGCRSMGRLDLGLGDDWKNPLGVTAIDVLEVATGAVQARFDGDVLEIDDAQLASITTIADLDGDEIDELAVGFPYATACSGQCVSGAGQVVIISPTTGRVLSRINGEHKGGNFGWSVASVGNVLLVGAPSERDAQNTIAGAVHLYDVSGIVAGRRTDTWFGTSGSSFGSALLAIDHDSNGTMEVLVGSSGATTSYGSSTGRIALRTVDGALLRTFDGVLAGARMGARETQMAAIPGVGLIASAPDAASGQGRAWFYPWSQSKPQKTFSGTTGERLGTSLAVVDADDNGSLDIALGVPGAFQGRGAVRVVSTAGSPLRTISANTGASLGMWLSTPGDLDGDGVGELLVSARDVGPRAVGTLVIHSK